MTQTYIAYIRVSTEKQRSQGVSLDEQRRAITAYATRHQFTITAWYEERCTAARRGRPIFSHVMQLLKKDKGQTGLLMHKIDRGARNLRDWADIGDALDQGIIVCFAHDDVDMHTRGGRLTADIQAVIAADYIRNLQEEVKKGIVGRLRQGLFPFGAPRGYRNCGSGKAKVPYPSEATLVIAAFSRYATGAYSLRSLAEELSICGLTSRRYQPLNPKQLSALLRNPFYTGRIVVKGETYTGIHQPLITEAMFACVQAVLKSKHPRNPRRRHHFRYARHLRCLLCGRHLAGELQKGWVYYRCGRCRGVCVREDRVGSRNQNEPPRWQLEIETTFALQPFSKFDSTQGCAKTRQNQQTAEN